MLYFICCSRNNGVIKEGSIQYIQGQVWARTINTVRPGVQKQFICKQSRENERSGSMKN